MPDTDLNTTVDHPLPSRAIRSLRIPRAVLLGLTVAYLMIGAFFVYRLADRSHLAVADQLETRVQSSRRSIERLVDRARLTASTAAKLPAVVAVVTAGHNDAAIQGSDEMHRQIDPLLTVERVAGISLLDANATPLRLSDNDSVITRTLEQHPEIVKRINSSENYVSPIVVTAVPLPNKNGTVEPGQPTMFAASQVLNESGTRIGTIILRLRPALLLDVVLQGQRVDRSDDAFAYRSDGIAVTSTRFDNQLQALGVLPAGSSAAMRLRLSDPGGNLTRGFHPTADRALQPLEHGVAHAIAGESGVDVDGYRDYRGVEVVGAWTWIPAIAIGVSFEVDRSNALEMYLLLRQIYFALGIGIMLTNLAAWRGLRVAARLRVKRAEAERAVVAREETLLTIIDSSPNAILILDARGAITRVNDTTERHFRRPRAILVNMMFHEVVAPVNPPADASIEALLAAVRVEAFGIRGDGTEFPADIRWSAVTLEEKPSFVIIGIDATERHATESALIAAKVQAEQAAKAKSEFLAMMSHEIRTPMNGVLGMTSLLADTPLSPEQRQYVDATKRSAQLLMSVINDILDFSKVEAGKMSIEPIPFDLQVAVAEVAELLAPRAIEKEIELVVNFAAGAPRRVIGDSGRIRQVLMNFAGNALKFTETGHVVIAVTGMPREPGKICIEVQDTGIGISADKLALLYEPFTQADASTTRRFGGTGLGLSISKRLVELMGGEVGVRSVEGEGSTFWFTLQLEVDPNPAPAPTPTASLKGVRAIVIDDVPINVQVMREWMRGWGLRVDTAENGEDALVVLRSAATAGDPVRLAVVDYLMPNMDGESLAREIRADHSLDGISLVLATSSASRGDAERFHQAGYNAYLTKPLRPETLAVALETVMAREAGWREADVIVTRHSLNERSATVKQEAQTAADDQVRTRAADTAHPLLRVLVAEDNPVNQMVATKMLERLNCRVDIANDGNEAVSMSLKFPYAVIFMDVQMPNLDGLEATRQIRSRGGVRVPVIAMTANAMQGDRERCLEAGMDDYVSKPITPDALRLALKRLVSPALPATPA